MPTTESDSVMSRLCSRCGFCCNGVLFRYVELQPGDSIADLSALGLKLKRRKGKRQLMQPCPAHENTSCRIYENRPTRCRLFECRQIKQVKGGDISEEEALRTIAEGVKQVADLEDLLEKFGGVDPRKSWKTNYDRVVAEPIDPTGDEDIRNTRAALETAREKLTDYLQAHFRVDQEDAQES